MPEASNWQHDWKRPEWPPPGVTAQVTAAIVTCGGLCPGLNDVVQNIVYTLADYGVPLDQVQRVRSSILSLIASSTLI